VSFLDRAIDCPPQRIIYQSGFFPPLEYSLNGKSYHKEAILEKTILTLYPPWLWYFCWVDFSSLKFFQGCRGYLRHALRLPSSSNGTGVVGLVLPNHWRLCCSFSVFSICPTGPFNVSLGLLNWLAFKSEGAQTSDQARWGSIVQQSMPGFASA